MQSQFIPQFIPGKTACQNQEDTEGDNIEGEQDILLVESAGVILYNLGRVIAPENFACHFRNILPLLLKRLVLPSIVFEFFSFFFRKFAIFTFQLV
jgi:hypothetical protein